MLWTPVERPLHTEPAPSDLTGARVLILGEPSEHRAAIAAALHARSALAELAYPGVGPSSAPEAWLVAGQLPTAIVDLTLAPPYGLQDRTTWRLPLLRTISALRACYEQWAAELAADRLFYLAVTYLGGGMGCDPRDDVAQPIGGLWAGLAKTLHRELPNCNARVVDVAADDQARLPVIVADELGRQGSFEVGYRGTTRLTLRGRVAPVDAPRDGLCPGSRVLISGGGRGIGYRLACRLAAEHGVHVVVTGRGPLAETEPWQQMTAEELATHHKSLWAQRGPERSVSDIRAEISRTHTLWELATNLRSARDRGLSVEYRQCDVTQRGPVRAILKDLGDIRGVVHNAGIDSPSRLPNKTDDQVLRTVSTKLDGFMNLFLGATELGLDLDFFCTVGSLTGRLGGMVGQFDYAAANDVLARLGMWAQRQAPFPVMTLAWPTWDQVGLITNFAASLRYMSALDVEEGLDLWCAELCAATSGEVSYVGALGRALDPKLALGFLFPPDLPDHDATAHRLFHLGDVRRYEPGRSLVAEVNFDPAEAAAVGDLLVDGRPAVPVGLLVESAIGAADWVMAPEEADLVLQRIEDLVIRPALLSSNDDGARFLREVASGRMGDERWVEAIFHRVDAPEALPAARLRMLFGPDRPGRPDGAAIGPRTGSLPATDDGVAAPEVSMRWRGRVLPVAESNVDGSARGSEAADHDRWVVTHPPASALPVGALENVLRLVVGTTGSVEDGLLHVGRVDVRGTPGREYVLRHRGAHWTVTDPSTGRAVLDVGPVTTGIPKPTIDGSTNNHGDDLHSALRNSIKGATS
jgi:NAD(P)-dependent dehydrogenase (short-subunit alcohol dehydrogenase family)